MSSATDIANSALTKLGADRILNLADNQKEAREINAIYTMRRDALLRAYNWSFAMTRANLSALVDTPAWGYSYFYQLPTDCLRVVQVNDIWVPPSMSDYISGPDMEPYKIEGRKIATDYGAPLKIRYSQRVTDSGNFDAMFVEAFACDLAFHACEAITQSTSKKDSAREDKREAILMAIRANAIELPPQVIADDSWILSRL
jgi:hypothetical protein